MPTQPAAALLAGIYDMAVQCVRGGASNQLWAMPGARHIL